MQGDPTSFKTNEKRIWAAARRVLRRVQAAGGGSIQIEDIFTELTIAGRMAQQRFKPEENPGVPFAAFLQRGMWLHINRWVKEELGEFQIAPFELDAPNGNDGEDDEGMHRRIADESVEAPDDAV